MISRFDRELGKAKDEAIKEENAGKEPKEGGDSDDERNKPEHKFSKEGMTKILLTLGFLPINGKIDPRTQGLIDDIWTIV